MLALPYGALGKRQIETSLRASAVLVAEIVNSYLPLALIRSDQ